MATFLQGAVTETVATGIRGSALATAAKDFDVQPNVQPLCEDAQLLTKLKASSVDEAVAACRQMERCKFFGFFSYTAGEASATRVAYLCAGEALETVSPVSGWVTGVKRPLSLPLTLRPCMLTAENGPLLE